MAPVAYARKNMGMNWLPEIRPPHVCHINAFVDHRGGCYTCRWFGENMGGVVWCGYPGGGHLRSKPNVGCASWEREPGADDWRHAATLQLTLYPVDWILYLS